MTFLVVRSDYTRTTVGRVSHKIEGHKITTGDQRLELPLYHAVLAGIAKARNKATKDFTQIIQINDGHGGCDLGTGENQG